MMNRVYGALAFACEDETLRNELTANLKGIVIEFVMSPDYKFAKYVDGVFTVGIWWWEGERGVFYEYELVPALRGERVGQEWVEEPLPDVSEEAQNAAPAEPSVEFSSDLAMPAEPSRARRKTAGKSVPKKPAKKAAAKPMKKPAKKQPAARKPAPKKAPAKQTKGGKKNGLRRR
jgi:hypothetical protein